MTKRYLLYLISKFTDTVEREKDFLGDYESTLKVMKEDLETIRSAVSHNPDVLRENPNSFIDTLSKVDESLMECVAEAKRRKERREGVIDCMRFSAQCKWKKGNYDKSLQQWKDKIQDFRTKIKSPDCSPQQENKRPEATKIEPESEWSSSVFDDTKIHGWEDQVREIYKDMKQSDEELNTVGIVGLFGSGKTKLAQKVFAKEEVMDRFSLRLWVWVSKGCSREELLRRTLDNLGVEKEEIESALELAKKDELEAEGVLLFLLHLQLLDKRYLIVFDDVRETDAWYCNLHNPAPDDGTQWNRLAHGLPKGSGGAIIVTSRSEDDARRMVGRGAIHTPERMSTEDAWKVFKEAYLGADKKESPQLEKMKDLITEKCARLPVALKIAGRDLPPPEEEAEEGKEEKGEEGMEKDKEEEAAKKKEEEGGKGTEKEEKRADDEGEETKESPARPPEPEEEKDKEGVKKDMARGKTEEERARARDEEEKESPPPPPPRPPPPPPPLKERTEKEKDMEPAAPPLEEKKEKEAMQKETSTGDEKEKGNEPAAASLEEKKEMSTGDEEEKGKEPTPPPPSQDKEDKESMQKETPLHERGEGKPAGDEKEKGKESVADQKQGSA